MRQDARISTPNSEGPFDKALLLTLLGGRYDVRGQEWPESGSLASATWSPQDPATGLVGVLWGEGTPDEAPVEFDRWVVWETSSTPLVELASGEFRAPSGVVVYSGGQKGASDYLLAHGAEGRPIVGLVATMGDDEGVIGGYYSRVLAGHDARIRVEHGSCVSAGDRAFVAPRSGCRVRVGDDATILGNGGEGLFVLGHRCRLEGDVRGVQVYAGRGAVIGVGERSHVESGPYSVVTLGDRSWFRVGMGTKVDHLTSAYSRDGERTHLGSAGLDLAPGALYFVSEDARATLVEGASVSPTPRADRSAEGLRVDA